MTELDTRLFRKWLVDRGIGSSTRVSSRAYRAYEVGAVTPDMVEKCFPNAASNYKKDLRNAVRWANTYEGCVL